MRFCQCMHVVFAAVALCVSFAVAIATASQCPSALFETLASHTTSYLTDCNPPKQDAVTTPITLNVPVGAVNVTVVAVRSVVALILEGECANVSFTLMDVQNVTIGTSIVVFNAITDRSVNGVTVALINVSLQMRAGTSQECVKYPTDHLGLIVMTVQPNGPTVENLHISATNSQLSLDRRLLHVSDTVSLRNFHVLIHHSTINVTSFEGSNALIKLTLGRASHYNLIFNVTDASINLVYIPVAYIHPQSTTSILTLQKGFESTSILPPLIIVFERVVLSIVVDASLGFRSCGNSILLNNSAIRSVAVELSGDDSTKAFITFGDGEVLFRFVDVHATMTSNSVASLLLADVCQTNFSVPESSLRIEMQRTFLVASLVTELPGNTVNLEVSMIKMDHSDFTRLNASLDSVSVTAVSPACGVDSSIPDNVQQILLAVIHGKSLSSSSVDVRSAHANFTVSHVNDQSACSLLKNTITVASGILQFSCTAAATIIQSTITIDNTNFSSDVQLRTKPNAVGFAIVSRSALGIAGYIDNSSVILRNVTMLVLGSRITPTLPTVPSTCVSALIGISASSAGSGLRNTSVVVVGSSVPRVTLEHPFASQLRPSEQWISDAIAIIMLTQDIGGSYIAVRDSNVGKPLPAWSGQKTLFPFRGSVVLVTYSFTAATTTIVQTIIQVTGVSVGCSIGVVTVVQDSTLQTVVTLRFARSELTVTDSIAAHEADIQCSRTSTSADGGLLAIVGPPSETLLQLSSFQVSIQRSAFDGWTSLLANRTEVLTSTVPTTVDVGCNTFDGREITATNVTPVRSLARYVTMTGWHKQYNSTLMCELLNNFHTITVLQPSETIRFTWSAARVAAASGTMSVGMISSLALPGLASTLQRVAVTLQVADCGLGDVTSAPSPSDSPLQLLLGNTEDGGYVRGAIVGNTVFVLGLCILLMAVGLWNTRRHQHAWSHPMVRLYRAARSVSLPGNGMVPTMLLLQPTISAGVTEIGVFGGDSIGDLVTGIFGVIVLAIPAGFLAFRGTVALPVLALRVSRHRRHGGSGTSEKRCGTHSWTDVLRAALHTAIAERWRWIARGEAARRFAEHFGRVYEGYAWQRTWFVWVEISGAVALGILVGLQPENEASCLVQQQVNVAIGSLLFLVGCVLPYNALMANMSYVVTQALSLSASVLLVIGNTKAASTISITSIWISIAFAALDAVGRITFHGAAFVVSRLLLSSQAHRHATSANHPDRVGITAPVLRARRHCAKEPSPRVGGRQLMTHRERMHRLEQLIRTIVRRVSSEPRINSAPTEC